MVESIVGSLQAPFDRACDAPFLMTRGCCCCCLYGSSATHNSKGATLELPPTLAQEDHVDYDAQMQFNREIWELRQC